ncbi:MAG: carbohydrate-binding domain-containing protein, partial [Acetatifactor sp.]|nr:carbohydrate-binding domain-containing protein [Acetatifactor sp.]
MFKRQVYNHGIVCNDDMVITGGNITIYAVQDGIHANDSVCIRNSALSISAGDDGITVSNDDETAFLYVESGSIYISSCYEGLEAIDITIAGGTIDIIPTDDGINANGSGIGSVIRITGGDITIINPSGRDADGLDSNGSIYIEGGRVFISVSDSGGNYALDYGSENGGECVVSGGTVIACGSSAMAEGFNADSPQGFLMYNTTAEAGTTIRLEDSLGGELLSVEIPCSFSSIVLSTPGLEVGDVCTLVIGDVQEQITIDNTSSSGFNPSGMFGGRGHGGAFGERTNDFAPSQGQGLSPEAESSNAMEAPEGMRSPDGMGRPEGMEFPDGMEHPDSMESPEGMEFPDSMESPDGMEHPDGIGASDDMEFPDGMERLDGMELPDGIGASDDMKFPDGMEPPDGMRSPDGMDPPDGMRSPDDTEPLGGMRSPDDTDPLDGGNVYDGENESDRQEMQEVSGRPLFSGEKPSQGNGTHPQQQVQGQMSPQEELSSSNISADTLALLGISVLALMVGLITALK